MNNDLIVFCDSVNNNIEFRMDSNMLCKLTWGIHDNSCGFFVENADHLVNVYFADFFVLSEAAIVQFIINVANKIKLDQQLSEIIYLSSSGEQSEYPMFLPYTMDDEDLLILPHQQLSLCEIWKTFKTQMDGFLSLDFLDELVPGQLREGFLDLVNAELSLLRKEEA